MLSEICEQEEVIAWHQLMESDGKSTVQTEQSYISQMARHHSGSRGNEEEELVQGP